MTGFAHRAIGLCLILVLIGGLMTKAAQAEDGSRDRDKPIRLYAAAAFGPIGALSWNPTGSNVTINGRLAYGEQAIWNGDEIETTAGPNIRILLNSMGQVTLTGGARARLATTLTRLDDEITARVLIASLISGDMMVRLQQEAVAYVEACGSAYTSSRGASFRIEIRGGRAMAETAIGAVTLGAESPQINCAIRSVTIDGSRRVTGPASDRIRVERRKPQNINLQLICNGQPVRGQPILITLRKNIGRIGSQVITKSTDDVEGVVTVTFTPGGSANSSDITADAVGLKATPWIGHITIPGFWTPRNKFLVSLAIVAAGVGGCTIGCGGGNNRPVGLGPTTSKP